jgi:hypothetical protein
MGDEKKEERSAVEVAASGAGAATPLAATAFSAAIAATTFTIPHVDSAEGGGVNHLSGFLLHMGRPVGDWHQQLSVCGLRRRQR